MTDLELMKAAEDARERSYCSYSGFSVGAALLSKNGQVYTGCNIENSAFSPTVCAERVAFFSAINAGEREFLKIAIVGGKVNKAPDPICSPCGVCRQVMGEFCGKDFAVILGNSEKFETYTLEEILPLGFILSI